MISAYKVHTCQCGVPLIFHQFSLCLFLIIYFTMWHLCVQIFELVLVVGVAIFIHIHEPTDYLSYLDKS